MKRSILASLAVGLLAIWLVACGDDDSTTSTESPAESSAATTAAAPTPTDAPSVNLGGTLAVAFRQDITGFDPHTETASADLWLTNVVYEGLVTQNPDFTVRPALAESWEPSADAKTWTFHLREGVTFSDGSSLDASVVKKSFDRAFASSPQVAFATTFFDAAGVEVVDPTTVRFNLKVGYGLFPLLVKGYPFLIVSAEAIDSGVDLRTNAVGTGPFVLTSYTPASKVEFEKNPDYWGVDDDGVALPYLDGMVWNIIPDATQRMNALTTGEADVAQALDSAQYETVAGDSDLYPAVFAAGRLAGIEFNTNREPFNNADLRRAFSLAIDRETLVEVALGGLGEPAYGVFPEDSLYYDPSIKDADSNPDYQYDPDAARQALVDAGFPDGFDRPDLTLWANAEAVDVDRAAEIVQQQLAEVGINISVKFCPIPECSTFWTSGDFDLTVLHHPHGGDPLIQLSDTYQSTGKWNLIKAGTPAVDAAIQAALAETDEDARIDLGREAQLDVVNSDPYRYDMFWLSTFDGVSADVEGYELLPDAIQRRWDNVSLAP